MGADHLGHALGMIIVGGVDDQPARAAGGQLVALLGSLDNDDFNEPGLPPDAPSARLQCVLAGGAPCEFRILPIESKQLAYWLGGTPGEKPDANMPRTERKLARRLERLWSSKVSARPTRTMRERLC